MKKFDGEIYKERLSFHAFIEESVTFNDTFIDKA